MTGHKHRYRTKEAEFKIFNVRLAVLQRKDAIIPGDEGKWSRAMLKNGKYAAWYKTPSKQGTGVVYLLDGSITGGDSILSYSGTYAVSADEFTAVLKTSRHSKGHDTIFGVDDLTLVLKGKVVGRIAKFIGTAEEFPETPFEGTLIQSEHEQPKPNREIPTFDLQRLPSPVRSR